MADTGIDLRAAAIAGPGLGGYQVLTIDATLQRHVPALPEPDERRLALLTLDAVLHDEYAPSRPPVQAFLARPVYDLF